MTSNDYTRGYSDGFAAATAQLAVSKPVSLLEQRISLFTKSRKSKLTREYARDMVNFLEANLGWVRSKEFRDAFVPEKIPNASSFYNLLTDMVAFGLVEREYKDSGSKKRGRPPVYYRCIQ